MKGKPVSDEEIREAWGRLIDGRTETGCVDVAAEELGVGHAALTMRLRKLGLPYPGRRKPATDPRLPYSPPSVATLPLNGNGNHAEVAREMVTEAAPVDTQTAEAVMAVPATLEAPAPQLPSNLSAFLADMRALGGQVEVSGEVNVNIRIRF